MGLIIDRQWATLTGYTSNDLLSASLTVKTTKSANIFSRMWVYLFGGSLAKAKVAQAIHTFVTKPEVQAFLQEKGARELHDVQCNLRSLMKRFSLHSNTSKTTQACASLLEAIKVIGDISREKNAPAKVVEAPIEVVVAPASQPAAAEETAPLIEEEEVHEHSPVSEMRVIRCLRSLMEYGTDERGFVKEALMIILPQIFGMPASKGRDLYLNLYRKCHSPTSARADWDPEAKMAIGLVNFDLQSLVISPARAERMIGFANELLRGILKRVCAAETTTKKIKTLAAKQAQISEQMDAQIAMRVKLKEQEVPANDERLVALEARLASLDAQYKQLEAQKASMQAQASAPRKQ